MGFDMAIWDATLFESLSIFAAEWHRDQVVPNGRKLPYFLHLTQVCNRAMRAAIERPELDINLIMACAILHDVLEDCATTPELYEQISTQILEAYGVEVLNGVKALSKTEILDAEGNRDKSAMMTDSLHRIQQQPPEVWAVKLADRICNLQSPPPHWKDKKKQAYLDEARKIYRALHSSSPILAGELWERIENYAQYINSIE